MKMKNVIIAICILFGFVAYAQQNAVKNDIIMTQDGQVLQVKVNKVTENTVSFTYPGESVINEIQSNGINKIIFASGRTQNFGGTATGTPAVTNNQPEPNQTIYSNAPVESLPAFEKNTMTIIPVKFMKNGTYDKILSREATDLVVDLTAQNSDTSGIKVQEKEEAIKKLLKSGINYEKLRSSSPEALRKVLGTEYLLYVSIEEKKKRTEEKNSISDYDFLSDQEPATQQGKPQIEFNAQLKIYDANSAVEAFEVDFFETVFKRDPKSSDTPETKDNYWRLLIKYLTDRLLSSKVFISM